MSIIAVFKNFEKFPYKDVKPKKKIYLIFKFFKIMNICHIIRVNAGTGTLQMTINIANSQAKKK